MNKIEETIHLIKRELSHMYVHHLTCQDPKAMEVHLDDISHKLRDLECLIEDPDMGALTIKLSEEFYGKSYCPRCSEELIMLDTYIQSKLEGSPVIIETLCPNCQNVRLQQLQTGEKLHCLKCGNYPLQVISKSGGQS